MMHIIDKQVIEKHVLAMQIHLQRYEQCMINDNLKILQISFLGVGLPKNITNQYCVALGSPSLALLRLIQRGKL